MTQAFNLAQLANNLNTSGQLDATDGLTGLVTNANLASSGSASSSTYLRGDRVWAALPALGKVLQVQQYVKTNTYSGSGDWSDPGLDVSITPSSTSSKILVMVSIAMGTDGTTVGMRLRRNGTDICQSTSENGSVVTTTVSSVANNAWQTTYGFTYLDSPSSTSALTYDIVIKAHDTRAYYLNRSGTGPSGTGGLDNATSCSSITVIEIGA